VYAIFKVEKEKEANAKDAMKDDLVSRQSIIIRDSKSLGMDTNCIYIKIEGSKEGIDKAKEIFDEFGELLSEKEAAKINKKIREDEESASVGIGFIFGE
jgi:hypothetical protein